MNESSSVPNPSTVRGLRKERVGQVVSTKMDKTLVVETTTRVPHAKFGKIVTQLGDTVLISETRPLSKLKRWRLLEVIKH